MGDSEVCDNCRVHNDSDSLPIRDSGYIPSEPEEPGVDILVADVVVIGSGLAGLVAARECARIGARVVVTGGLVATAGDTEPADARHEVIDVPQDAEFARDGDLADLAVDLGLDELIEVHTVDGDWWLKLDDEVVPVPQATLVGIPSSPLAADVARVLGQGGALRAYLDRLRPILTIGRATNLATLVRKRMGKRIWDRMVAPVVAARFEDDPETTLVAAVSPALNAAMTRQGSLSGGVNEVLAVEAETPERAVMRDGLHQIIDALGDNCRSLHVALRPGLGVTAVDEVPNASDVTDRWRVHHAEGGLIRTRAVILALDRAQARSLTADLLAAAWRDWPAAHRSEVTTIVLDAPELDGAPRGPGVVAYSGEERTSKVVAHLQAGHAGPRPGGPHHTVRLTTRDFSPQSSAGDGIRVETEPDDTDWPRATRPLNAAEAAVACAQVADLLGIALRPESVVEAVTRRELLPQSPAAQGQASRAGSFQEAVEAHPGLAIAGDWLAGPGIDAMVSHARAAAQEIRGLLVAEGFHPHL